MIKELIVGNYKALGLQQAVPLAPITLVYGPNSGGKSSLIQSLLTLTQTAAWQPPFQSRGPLCLMTKGALVDSGSFISAVHRHDSSLEMLLGLSVEDEVLRNTHAQGQGPYKRPFRARVDFGFQAVRRSGTDQRGRVSSVNYSVDGETPFALSFLAKGEFGRRPEEAMSATESEDESDEITSLRLAGKVLDSMVAASEFGHDHYELGRKASSLNLANLTYRTLSTRLEGSNDRPMRVLAQEAMRRPITLTLRSILDPVLIDLREQFLRRGGAFEPSVMAIEYVEEALRIVSNSVKAHLRHVRYLGPLRSHPERFYVGASNAADSVGVSGENLMRVLSAEAERGGDDESLVGSVNKWFEKLEIPYCISVRRVSDAVAGDLHVLDLLDLVRRVPVSPRDVGFGFSQLLPIIVEGLLASRSSVTAFPILCVEQPEIHLHPRLQAHVADFLIDTSSSSTSVRSSATGTDRGRRLQWVVETHSEALLLRIQRRIREKRLKAKDVSVLYIAADAAGSSRVLPLRLDEDGDFIDEWPGGFFEEAYRERFASR